MAETVLDAKQKAAPKSDGIEIDWLRQSQPMTNGQVTAQVGAYLAIGGVAGIVERMTMLPNGVVRVLVKAGENGNGGVVLLWPTGMEGRGVK